MLAIRYETEFELHNPVSDFDAAQKYLVEDDMTQYLKEDYDIPQGVRDSVISIAWELETDDSGVIALDTNRELSPEELAPISRWVKGQNSDGLGESFEQQSFAEYYDEEQYESDYDCWYSEYEDGLDEWDSLSEEEQEEFDREDYAFDYAEDHWGYEPDRNDSDYYRCASFDWLSNDYIFTRVE